MGKHTQQYCSRAVKRSTNEIQKKILFIAAAGADEFIAKLLNVQAAKPKWTIKRITSCEKISPQKSALALKVYLSALMAVLSNSKGQILEKSGLTEAEWLELWCWVFEYGSEDKILFDSDLLTTYRQDGFEGILQSAGRTIFSALNIADSTMEQNLSALRHALTHDALVINRATI